MKFVDLDAQRQRLEPGLSDALRNVLDHGRFILGPEVQTLEALLAEFVGVKHAITCSSGTDALLLPLLAWGIGPGDAVFTTTFSFAATAEVICLLGATPVFVDIDERTFNLAPESLREAIDAVRRRGVLRPRAVIPVDLFGLPADYDAILPIARESGLLVLEDAAQAFGGRLGERRAGSFGDAAATSFFPAKPLGCFGDGGAVFTDDGDLATLLRSLRVHGRGADKYDNVRVGINGRLDTLQAAVLIEKLKVFPGELEERARVAQRYFDALTEHVGTPPFEPHFQSAWAQYSILCARRNELAERLKAAGIPSAVYYRKPLHLQPAYEGRSFCAGSLETAVTTATKILSLPMHPYLSEDDQQRVVREVLAHA